MFRGISDKIGLVDKGLYLRSQISASWFKSGQGQQICKKIHFLCWNFFVARQCCRIVKSAEHRSELPQVDSPPWASRTRRPSAVRLRAMRELFPAAERRAKLRQTSEFTAVASTTGSAQVRNILYCYCAYSPTKKRQITRRLGVRRRRWRWRRQRLALTVMTTVVRAVTAVLGCRVMIVPRAPAGMQMDRQMALLARRRSRGWRGSLRAGSIVPQRLRIKDALTLILVIKESEGHRGVHTLTIIHRP